MKKPIGYKLQIQPQITEVINMFLQMGVIAPQGSLEYLQIKLADIFKSNIIYNEEDEPDGKLNSNNRK